MDKNIESFLKQALQKIRSKASSYVKGKCLTEENIACIIDGKIAGSEREKIFGHILSCQKCALTLKDHLMVLNAIDKKGMLETPQAAIQAAMGLVDSEVGTNILEVVLNLKEKIIELVKTTGYILRGPQLIPISVLRSQGEDDQFPNEVKIVKEFGNIITEVGVEKRKLDLCDVEIRLTEKETKKKIEGFRVTLIKDNREIESTLIEGGKVIFRELKPDKYTISITKEDQKLGKVDLLITRSK